MGLSVMVRLCKWSLLGLISYNLVGSVTDYKQLCLKSFSINRSGEVIQKEALLAPRQITFEANPGKL
jgi:hypothetical protein